MIVKYIGETDASLTNGKEYEVICIEESYYRIVDNSGEDYLFPPEEFEIICHGTDNFYKNKRSDKIWWVDTSDRCGEWVFSFDKKTLFNMFADYPHKLTPEQKEIFDRENPYWANFFSDRTNENRGEG